MPSVTSLAFSSAEEEFVMRRGVGIVTLSMLVGALSLFVAPVAGASTNRPGRASAPAD